MKRRLMLAAVFTTVFAPIFMMDALFAQSPSKSPIASSPVVELKGKIQKVQLAMGQGMPYLEVESAGKTEKVMLGSMRYLMEKDFNPKAGMDVELKGYRTDAGIVAIRVQLPSEKKSLLLRDEDGWPVWMRGRHGKQ